MKMLEFGNPEKKKILLIHGFQLPWQVWEEYIAHYQENFHLLVPVMSGHHPEEPEDFHSFDEDAKAIEDYIIPRYGSSIHAVYGMSMGGVLAATLWQNRRLTFDKVLFDGSPLVSLPPVMRRFMTAFYLAITHSSQRRDPKTLRQAVRAIIPAHLLDRFLAVLDGMSDATIVNSLHSIAAFQLCRSIDTPDTAVCFFHGTAMNEMLARTSAKYLKRYYPDAIIRLFPGKSHCKNALFAPQVMLAELDSLLLP